MLLLYILEENIQRWNIAVWWFVEWIDGKHKKVVETVVVETKKYALFNPYSPLFVGVKSLINNSRMTSLTQRPPKGMGTHPLPQGKRAWATGASYHSPAISIAWAARIAL